MNLNPTPWEAYLPKAVEGSLQGTVAKTFWHDRGESAALQGYDSPYYVLLRGKSPAGYQRGAHAKPNLLVEIGEYENLRENWDGDGAVPISAEALGAARRFALALPSEVSAETAPNPTGTISFYLETLGGRAELEIGRTRFTWTFLPAAADAVPTSRSGSLRDIPAGEEVGQLLGFLRAAPVEGQPVVLFSLGAERRAPAMSAPRLMYLHRWAEDIDE